MYALIQAGGHQYKVAQGDALEVDKLAGEIGTKVIFDKVLALGGDKNIIGAPTVPGAVVEGVIKEQKRAPKIIVFKYKRRKNYKRTRGHKQSFTVVEIKKISTK